MSCPPHTDGGSPLKRRQPSVPEAIKRFRPHSQDPTTGKTQTPRSSCSPQGARSCVCLSNARESGMVSFKFFLISLSLVLAEVDKSSTGQLDSPEPHLRRQLLTQRAQGTSPPTRPNQILSTGVDSSRPLFFSLPRLGEAHASYGRVARA